MLHAHKLFIFKKCIDWGGKSIFQTWAPYQVQCPCLQCQHQPRWILPNFPSVDMGTLSKTVRFSLYPSQWVRNWCDYLDLTSLKFLMLWFVMIFQGIFMVFLWFLVGFYGFSFFLSFPPSMMGFFTKPSGPMFWASLTIVFPMVAKHRSSDAMFAMYRWRLPSGDQLARRYRNAMRCLRCIA